MDGETDLCVGSCLKENMVSQRKKPDFSRYIIPGRVLFTHKQKSKSSNVFAKDLKEK